LINQSSFKRFEHKIISLYSFYKASNRLTFQTLKLKKKLKCSINCGKWLRIILFVFKVYFCFQSDFFVALIEPLCVEDHKLSVSWLQLEKDFNIWTPRLAGTIEWPLTSSSSELFFCVAWIKLLLQHNLLWLQFRRQKNGWFAFKEARLYVLL